MNITDEADLSKAVSESFTTGFLLNLLLTHDDINHAAVLECDSLQTGEYLETVGCRVSAGIQHQPASQPARRVPASQPANQPASQPARRVPGKAQGTATT